MSMTHEEKQAYADELQRLMIQHIGKEMTYERLIDACMVQVDLVAFALARAIEQDKGEDPLDVAQTLCGAVRSLLLDYYVEARKEEVSAI